MSATAENKVTGRTPNANNPIDDDARKTLFLDARTFNNWQDKPVEDAVLHELHDLVKYAPTSANCSPMRVVFVKSLTAKERLKPHLDKGNADKTMSAPVTAIIAQDMEFYEHLPKLFPHTDARSWFAGNDKKIAETAFRNSSLQGGYFILAARGLGLDCGPMSGFNEDGLNGEFFADTPYKVNFICNLGYGDPEGLFPRSPRFDFDDICKII